jgi:hypothetical protein
VAGKLSLKVKCGFGEFGIGIMMSMMKKPVMDLETYWRQLRDPGFPVVEEVWPRRRQLSFLEAVAERDVNKFRDLESLHHFISAFQRVPVIAVAGLINSGKSSLVASFLSEESRGRILIGEESSRGTQRFTLWISKRWEQDAIFFEQLEKMLALVFGHAPERLAAGPDQAFEQQRDQEKLQVPLLATDGNLDEHGIALLDCPDIQRPQKMEKQGENLRLEALAQASELCAGVIIVSPRTALEIRDLQLIIARMPRATRILAINFMRLEAAHEVLQEAREKLELTSEFCYGAYDFLVDANARYAPAWDGNFQIAIEQRKVRGFPSFFELGAEAEKNQPDAISPDRSILRLAGRIPVEAMRQKRHSELMHNFQGKIRQELLGLQADLETRNEEAARAAGRLFEACGKVLREGDELRIKMDPEIVASFKESMERTAAWYLKPFMLANRHLLNAALKAVRMGKDAPRKLLKIPEVRAVELPKLKKQMKNPLLKPEEIRKALSFWSGGLGVHREEKFWAEDAEQILQRYQQEEKTNMDAEEWDKLTRQMWTETPKFQARIQVIGSFFLSLTAIILIPFDAGTSVTGITFLHLIGAVGFGHLAGTHAYLGLQETMKEKIGEQQFSNFFAIVCDRIGCPRSPGEDPEIAFRKPLVEEKIHWESFGIKERRWSLWELKQENIQILLEMKLE